MYNFPQTDFERLQSAFLCIGVPFTLTDDSSEYPLQDSAGNPLETKDTVIVVQSDGQEAYFFFTKEGKYKDMSVLDCNDYQGESNVVP